MWSIMLFLNAPNLIIPLHFHLFHSSAESTWTSSIAWTPHLIIHPIFFIHLQNVREFGQLFENLSPDYLIPSSSSVFRPYVNLANCLETSHLIISSLPLRPSPVRMWIWLIVWISPIWSSHPSLIINLQLVREHGQIFCIPLMIAYPFLFIRLQLVREHGQCLNTSRLIIHVPSSLSISSSPTCIKGGRQYGWKQIVASQREWSWRFLANAAHRCCGMTILFFPIGFWYLNRMRARPWHFILRVNALVVRGCTLTPISL